MRIRRLILLSAFALPLALSLHAQDDSEALPESSEQVQIEVLVFRFPGKGAGAELKAGQARAASDGQRISTTGAEQYSEIAPSERQLAGAYSRLQASSDLKPMLFTAWRQNLSDARWVSLQPTDGASEKLSGRLLLTPGKPLGLKLELQLDGAQLMDSTQTASFRLRANRPAHFQETLYFDHPAMGALVRVDLTPRS
jgi:Peptidoglycan-binding protein, CsiV